MGGNVSCQECATVEGHWPRCPANLAIAEPVTAPLAVVITEPEDDKPVDWAVGVRLRYQPTMREYLTFWWTHSALLKSLVLARTRLRVAVVQRVAEVRRRAALHAELAAIAPAPLPEAWGVGEGSAMVLAVLQERFAQDVPRRQLADREIEGLIRSWELPEGKGDRQHPRGPLSRYLGLTEGELADWRLEIAAGASAPFLCPATPDGAHYRALDAPRCRFCPAPMGTVGAEPRHAVVA